VTIGLLGGRFDPPHNGHVALAKAALERLPIERLVVLVAERPGHAGVHASAEDRLAMARAAFAGLGDVELDPHPYTVDAVRGGRFGEAYFIVGADQAAAFETWKEPDEIRRWVTLAVGTRAGHAGDAVTFELESPDVSATAIRDRVARGEPIDDLVPPAVARVIEERGLYR
jgi:nicotinate-nucleotide adenylyltransferase